MKTVLKLRKKLREMSKIEEDLAAGRAVDALQQRKLERREAVAAELAAAEEEAAREEQVAVQARGTAAGEQPVPQAQAQQLCLTDALGSPEALLPCFEAFGDSFDLHVLVPVPVIMCDVCDMTGQPEQVVACELGGQAQPPFGWPAFVEEPPAAAFADTPAQPEAPTAASSAAEEESEQAKLSTSARRRQRRQRAAEKRSAAGLADACRDLPSPGSDDGENGLGHLDFAALTAALQAGGAEAAAAVGELKGHVAALAFDSQGCRMLQDALHLADQTAIAGLLHELRGHVRAALESPHANYVVQTVVTALPTAMSAFVVQELLGDVPTVAKHRFGCRVLCRLVEHVGDRRELEGLLDEVLDAATELCQDSFGHYVIQSVLEHLPQLHPRVLEALHSDLRGNACHRCASHVVEAVVSHCSEADTEGVVRGLLGVGPEMVLAIAANQYGSYVLRTLLQLPGRLQDEAVRTLATGTAALEGSKYGLRLLHDLGLAPKA